MLLYVAIIFRFTHAGSVASALLGRTPSAIGYQPPLATGLASPATIFAHLDATTVLARQIAELGIYPAVDPLDSTSRMLNPSIVGQRHYGIARSTQ